MAVSILLFFIISHIIMRWPTEAQDPIGCFSFNHNSTVLSVKIQDGIGSIETCIQQCQTRKATYAGVRYGHGCYCGDNHDHAVNGPQLNDNICTQTCNDHAMRCGREGSIVIHSICNRGHYRDNTTAEPNCDASCNCADNHICIYNTGSCPANCETGWSRVACNVRVVQSTPILEASVTDPSNNGVKVSLLTTVLTEDGAKVTVTSGASERTNNVAGTDRSKRKHPGISVTAVAVGVSLSVLVLVVIIALIVLFRRRQKPHKSGDEIDEGMTTPEVKTEDTPEKETQNGPTIYTTTETPEPCYSSVDHLNNGPAHIDGEDIPKSDDDVAINGELEIVEYAVVKKPGDEMHLNLKENSLYGTNAWDTDEEGQE